MFVLGRILLSTNILKRDKRMRTFKDLHPITGRGLGYPIGWVDTYREAWTTAAKAVVRPTVVNQEHIDDLLSCGLKWDSKDGRPPTPDTAFKVQLRFINQLVLDWLEAWRIGESVSAGEFMTWYTAQPGRFDALTQAWLHLLTDERLEIVEKLFAVAIRNLRVALQSLDDLSALIGPTERSLSVGLVTLQHDLALLEFGTHEDGIEASWPGATLVSLELGKTHGYHIGRLELPAAMHAFRTGVPPRRVVAWSLHTGEAVIQEVDQRWIETAIAGVTLSLERITHIRKRQTIYVNGGSHCLGCPNATDCEFDESDEHDPF